MQLMNKNWVLFFCYLILCILKTWRLRNELLILYGPPHIFHSHAKLPTFVGDFDLNES